MGDGSFHILPGTIPTTDDRTHSIILDIYTRDGAEYLFAGPTQISILYLCDPNIQIRKVDPALLPATHS